MKYSETCLSQTLNRMESCINQTLNRMESCINRTLDKDKMQEILVNLTCIETENLLTLMRFGLDMFHYAFIFSGIIIKNRGQCGSMSQVVGLPNNSYKPITNIAWVRSKGETIHHMYRNRDYFEDGSVHDRWRPLMIQTI